MKDIDDLKELWKVTREESDSPDEEAIKKILIGKSSSFVSKLKKGLLLDLTLFLLTYPVAIFVFFSRENSFEIFAWWIFVVTGVMALVYFALKYGLLLKMGHQTDTIASTLQTQATLLGKYLKVYLWIGMSIAPILSGLIIAKGAYESSIAPGYLAFAVGLWLALNLLFAFPLYFFNKWYINKLYGKHLSKLMENLSELRDIND
ncbi:MULTISPECIES: hypothetical protein [unclassified Imperialibacter]|uniref:hypothetical protein n=1 Tax=unclassified Imperialibacter TaxID=2629706 RepID=UPI00125821BC|nr:MULTISPECIES: hypothetical protein [unclassified Imperialibacter]CAD5250650.1 conserved membrane hypothetical protein [Imperialibacter sp. 75]CAD5286183.1 conserved membrane hypothetical protein [Imperialibacter sp. 89]VVT05343.1 conserved membrane hypothetical protein [Imperialibacter sp. EC-SDR9]